MSAYRLLKLKSFRKFYHTGSQRFRVLGIETSCDDTGVAVVDSDRNILGEAKYSQAGIHALHGGILPPLAKDLHWGNIKKAVKEAMDKSNLSIKDLDGIAVTVKPGIPSSLEVGIEYAKDLCTLYGRPLIPIHHMEAHSLTVRILEDVEFPFLVLLASGGHCILALAENVTKFVVLGESLDGAPGQVLDKVARKLNLRTIEELMLMQGGEAIEAAAKKGNPLAVSLKAKVKQNRECNFHYAGFQTAFLRFIEAEEKKCEILANQPLPNVYDICAAIQYELFNYICKRLEIGMRHLDFKNMINAEKRTLVVSGGVASNEFFRKMLAFVCTNYGYDLVVPPRNLCTDNGVMIAWNAIERLRENIPSVNHDGFHLVRPIPKSSMGENLTSDIIATGWKGNYLKYKTFLEKEMERESTKLLTDSTSKVNLSN